MLSFIVLKLIKQDEAILYFPVQLKKAISSSVKNMEKIHPFTILPRNI